MKVIIAGAGIGGLCAALALKNSGFDPEICERSELTSEAGAGIQLSPNAVKILIALGLEEPLAEVGFEPKAVRLRSFRSARLIAYRPLGAFSTDRYGAPYYHLHRQALHGLLKDAVLERRIPLHSGRPVTGFDEHPDRVEVHCGEERLTADALIGADGIHSELRRHFASAAEDAPRFTGMVAYRAVVDRAALPKNLVEPTATVWIGPGRHLVHYYVDGGQRINLVAVVETDSWREESWQTPAEPGELLQAFAGWHRKVQAVLQAAEDCHKWALHDRPPLARWSSDRVTLLGDAAHPMLPFLAQGAAMAMEDGWILSRLLEHREEEAIAPALDQYQRLRQLRTGKVAQASREQGKMFHLAAPNARLARDLKLGIGCRLLPDIAMAQYDWLHGYDPVRRFV
ncbi:MAG: FAD-dependent monooxygenase [Gammaproteobacteria bacterium]|nr:FAD-dependent monooxygenase [Gammaproteobacteria bacterium]